MPVTSTNRIPSSAARSDTRGLPNTRSGPGSNGSTTAQSSSETSHGDPLIPAPIVEITTGAPLQDRPTSSFSRLLKPALRQKHVPPAPTMPATHGERSSHKATDGEGVIVADLQRRHSRRSEGSSPRCDTGGLREAQRSSAEAQR